MTLPDAILLLLTNRALAADAQALLRAGDVPDALIAARADVGAHPKDVAAQELYLDLRIAVGQGAAALADARARAAANPADPDAQYLVGRASPDGPSSNAAYQAALKLAPGHARALMGLASVAEAEGRLSDALDGYARATAGDRSLGEAWVGQVRVLERLSRAGDALTVARAGLAAVPTEAGLVVAVARLGPSGDAVKVLEAGVAAIPGEPNLYEALASARLQRGDAAGALAAANQALGIQPALTGASRTALFASEVAAGRLDLAGLAALDQARALEGTDPKAAVGRYPALVGKYPRSALVLLGRAAARRAAGDRAAIDDLVAAAALDPANVEAAAAAGLALATGGRPAEAVPLLQRASTARPWDPSLGVGWFSALAATGKAADALDIAGAQARRFPTDPQTQVGYAELLLAANRAPEAYAVVKAALLATGAPALAAEFVRVAPAAGHPQEAAALLDEIVAKTGNQALADAAKKLRAAP